MGHPWGGGSPERTGVPTRSGRLFPLTPTEMLLAAAVVAAGAAVQASVGIGLSLIAAPLLLLIDRALVPGPLLAAAVVLALLVSYRDRAAIDRPGLGWILAGRLTGTVPAVFVMTLISARSFDLIFAALVILAVLLSLVHPNLRPTRLWAGSAGVLSGFMGTISSIGGPPVALVYQHVEGARLRGTLSGMFAVGCTASIVGLAAAGLFGRAELLLACVLAPGCIVGFTLSRWTLAWVDRGAVRPAVLILSLAAATVVLVRAIVGTDAGS